MPNVVANLFAPPRVEARLRNDDCLVLRSREALGEAAPSVAHLLHAGAEAHPDRVLATDSERQGVTWSEARATADALAQALLELASHNDCAAGSASRVARLLLLAQPPDLDAGEITDKGYINQRAVLDGRTEDLERLLAEPLHPAVITPAS